MKLRKSVVQLVAFMIENFTDCNEGDWLNMLKSLLFNSFYQIRCQEFILFYWGFNSEKYIEVSHYVTWVYLYEQKKIEDSLIVYGREIYLFVRKIQCKLFDREPTVPKQCLPSCLFIYSASKAYHAFHKFLGLRGTLGFQKGKVTFTLIVQVWWFITKPCNYLKQKHWLHHKHS